MFKTLKVAAVTTPLLISQGLDSGDCDRDISYLDYDNPIMKWGVQ